MAKRQAEQAFQRVLAAIDEEVRGLSPEDYRYVLESIDAQVAGRIEALDEEQDAE